MANEVSKISDKALASAGGALANLSKGMQTGQEELSATDYVIPRLAILQGLSPQVTQGKPEYDEDAKVGEIYDVSLAEDFGKTCRFVPVLSAPILIEWAPKRGPNSLRGIHSINSEIRNTATRNEKNKLVLPNGNFLAETMQFFGFNVSANWRQSFIPMASTALKKARFWNSLPPNDPDLESVGAVAGNLWYRSYDLSSAPETNDEGTWSNWVIERGPSIIELMGGDEDKIGDLVTKIDAFQKALKSDELRGDLSSMQEDGGSSSGDGGEVEV